MIVLVSNLWPRQRYYERLPEMLASLEKYRSDPVFDNVLKSVSLEQFIPATEDGREAGEDEEFGSLSSPEGTFDVLKQYMFFTLVLRATLLKYGGDVSRVIGYCSGLIPVLNVLDEGMLLDASLSNISPIILSQLIDQDVCVSDNVLGSKVATSIVSFKSKAPAENLILDILSRVKLENVYISERKSVSKFVLCGDRKNLNEAILSLSKAFPGQIIHSRPKPHGGLHTPLARPDTSLDLDFHSTWRGLNKRLVEFPNKVWSSYDECPDGASDIRFEAWVRSSFFDVVRTDKMVACLQQSGEKVVAIGLPNIIKEIFSGTEMRSRDVSLIGPEDL